MRPLTASELLDVWDQGARQSPVQRAVALLVPACAESSAAIAALPLGQRDDRLLALRSLTFGPALPCLVACPACGERLELVLEVAALRSAAPDALAEVCVLAIDEYSVSYRLPTSADLMTVTDEAGAGRALAGRCVVAAQWRGAALAVERLPEHAIAALSAAMAEHDPLADLQLALTCPTCAHAWQAPFDIAAYFWREIEAWAGRTLRDIHALAVAYGWREAEILALSPERRQRYIELVGV